MVGTSTNTSILLQLSPRPTPNQHLDPSQTLSAVSAPSLPPRSFSNFLSRANAKPTTLPSTKVLLGLSLQCQFQACRQPSMSPSHSLFDSREKSGCSQPSDLSPTLTNANTSANTCRPNKWPTPGFPNRAQDVSAIFGPTVAVCLFLSLGFSSVCVCMVGPSCFSLFLSVHMVRLSGFCPLVCPSFRLSVDLPAISPPVCLTVWRSVCQISAARSHGRNGSLPLFAGACLAGVPTSGLLPVGLPPLAPSRCRAACLSVSLSVGWGLVPVGRSVGLSLLACVSVCRPVGLGVAGLPVSLSAG